MNRMSKRMLSPIASVRGNAVRLLRALGAWIEGESTPEALNAKQAESERMACLGQLTAGVAHEINNPLTYVLLNTRALKQDLEGLLQDTARLERGLELNLGHDGAARLPDPSDLAAWRLGIEGLIANVSDIDEAARRIRDVVKDVNSFARLDTGGLAPVDLAQAAKDAVRLAHYEIKSKARLEVALPSLPLVRASAGRLVQVILNLLINAAHAIPADAPEKHSIRLRGWQEGERVCLEVRDSGTGIAPEDIPRIWERFYTTKKDGLGTGLGLAICRSIVESFGGQISAESRPGEGTSFTLALPLHSGIEAPSEVRAEAPQGMRGRILVLDDEAGLRSALKRLLGQDHDVLTVGNTLEFWRLIEADREFDLILCDMMMPGSSGMELLKRLEQFDAALADRLVFMSGGAGSPAIMEFMASRGALEKPIDGELLRRLAFEKVAVRRQASSPAGPPARSAP